MIEKLIRIQAELKVPKNRRNTFGNYNYRSCEDIVDAAKPLCHAEGFALILSDEVVVVGTRVYVKATAKLVNGEVLVCVAEGWAREAETQKGMNEAQITGSASSYARKYALNGLFAIDDVADADATNDHAATQVKKVYIDVDDVHDQLADAANVEELRAIFKKLPLATQKDKRVIEMATKFKDNLTQQ